MALKRVAIPSPNYSSRSGSTVRLIVIHTAEGARTYQELGNFFANPSSGVSSHTGIDDTPNTCGEYVRPADKAWTASGANPVAVQTELCAFAAWTAADWSNHPTMLATCAQWIAEEAARFNIPIRKLTAQQAQGSSAGVCGHIDLGSWGGGHWDPGYNFPWNQVISMALGGSPPSPTTKGGDMIAATSTGNGYWCVKPNGAIYAFGDAEYTGGANSPNVVQPGQQIVGIAGHGVNGYWLLCSDGSVFAFGTAKYMGRIP